MAFFGGGASVDLASPSAIGSTTPNTGAFTTLSFAPANNTTGFSNTSNSLTGSNSQSLINLLQTWNTTGTPTGLKFNITDTASNSASLIFDFQIGGTSRLSLRKDGRLAGAGTYGVLRSSGFEAHDGASIYFFVNPFSGNVGIYTSASIQWGAGAAPSNDQGDVKLFRDSSAILAQRNSTNAQTFRLYRTYTDASNYERLGFIATRTTRFAIAAENAGTGAARSLEFSFYTSASDPASTDITDGCFSVWKNSGTGTIKLWANDGGTMKSVALA